MSLDLAILGPDGSPRYQVSVGLNEHNKLMEFAAASQADLLWRLRDYYEDVEFSQTELDDLIGELSVVQSSCGKDDRLTTTLKSLIELARSAKEQNVPIYALAD